VKKEPARTEKIRVQEGPVRFGKGGGKMIKASFEGASFIGQKRGEKGGKERNMERGVFRRRGE